MSTSIVQPDSKGRRPESVDKVFSLPIVFLRRAEETNSMVIDVKD